MERNVVFVGPDQSIEECMALMTAKRLRHLPVIEHGDLLGIVSIGDLVKGIISDREFVIEQLEPAGVGALMALMEERKQRLAAEGLFDPARKRRVGHEIALALRGYWPRACVNPSVLAGSDLKRWQPVSMERGLESARLPIGVAMT